jgi:hypothetical protein
MRKNQVIQESFGAVVSYFSSLSYFFDLPVRNMHLGLVGESSMTLKGLKALTHAPKIVRHLTHLIYTVRRKYILAKREEGAAIKLQ